MLSSAIQPSRLIPTDLPVANAREKMLQTSLPKVATLLKQSLGPALLAMVRQGRDAALALAVERLHDRMPLTFRWTVNRDEFVAYVLAHREKLIAA